MLFFIAIMSHPDGDGWNRHLAAHAAYLRDLVAAESSGHLPQLPAPLPTEV
ncbi:hypothetical protein [Telmatospirillum sp.]|uniref:hypothetical protein n=1 Tax=Telmatospirillum sp. TaxID=2079197 RepID=UPI0028416D1D|nr:hypothetical protein [Telmatospirillum sp.]MDR3440931.1 hypothetical protein [Telmatospirillum sp.]